MMPCAPQSGQVAPLLISLAVGYGVLVLAKREARPLNRIGKITGWLIMLVSFIGLICIACSRLCRSCPTSSGMSAGMSCPWGGPKRAHCAMPPMTGEPGESPENQPAEAK